MIALVGGAAFGATKLAERVLDQAAIAGQADAYGEDMIRYSASETYFTFPAAVEEYYDGRYADRCPAEYWGCWQQAIIPDAACASLEVDVEFTNDETAWTGDEQETLAFANVAAGAVIPVVFGNDEYDFAWVSDVRCLDPPDPAYAGPSTSARRVACVA